MPTLNVTTAQFATNGSLSVMLASPAGQRDQNIFETMEEAQEQATDWLWTYNNDRPNNGHWRDYTCYETENGRKILQADPIKNGGLPTVPHHPGVYAAKDRRHRSTFRVRRF